MTHEGTQEKSFLRAECIDKKELTKKLTYWCTQWKDRLLSTEPADRALIEKRIRYVLRHYHKAHDIPIVWVQSPVMMAIIACTASAVYASRQPFNGERSMRACVERDHAIDAYISGMGFHRSIIHSIEKEILEYWGKRIDQRIMQWLFKAFRESALHSFNHDIHSPLTQTIKDALIGPMMQLRRKGSLDIVDKFPSLVITPYEVYSWIINDAIGCSVYGSQSNESIDDRSDRTIPLEDVAAIDIDVTRKYTSNIKYTENLDRVTDRYLRNLLAWWGTYTRTGSLFSDNLLIGTGYHTFLHYAFSLTPPRLLKFYCDLASTGWIYFSDAFVIVCDRPAVLRTTQQRDDRGVRYLLHAPDGPAIVWRDGTALWYINGVRVPRNVVEAPETLTGKQAMCERNAEVRRIMIDRMGTERFLRDIKATVRLRCSMKIPTSTGSPGDSLPPI